MKLNRAFAELDNFTKIYNRSHFIFTTTDDMIQEYISGKVHVK